jgi:hypothetical protein
MQRVSLNEQILWLVQADFLAHSAGDQLIRLVIYVLVQMDIEDKDVNR